MENNVKEETNLLQDASKFHELSNNAKDLSVDEKHTGFMTRATTNDQSIEPAVTSFSDDCNSEKETNVSQTEAGFSDGPTDSTHNLTQLSSNDNLMMFPKVESSEVVFKDHTTKSNAIDEKSLKVHTRKRELATRSEATDSTVPEKNRKRRKTMEIQNDDATRTQEQKSIDPRIMGYALENLTLEKVLEKPNRNAYDKKGNLIWDPDIGDIIWAEVAGCKGFSLCMLLHKKVSEVSLQKKSRRNEEVFFLAFLNDDSHGVALRSNLRFFSPEEVQNLRIMQRSKSKLNRFENQRRDAIDDALNFLDGEGCLEESHNFLRCVMCRMVAEQTFWNRLAISEEKLKEISIEKSINEFDDNQNNDDDGSNSSDSSNNSIKAKDKSSSKRRSTKMDPVSIAERKWKEAEQICLKAVSRRASISDSQEKRKSDASIISSPRAVSSKKYFNERDDKQTGSTNRGKSTSSNKTLASPKKNSERRQRLISDLNNEQSSASSPQNCHKQNTRKSISSKQKRQSLKKDQNDDSNNHTVKNQSMSDDDESFSLKYQQKQSKNKKAIMKTAVENSNSDKQDRHHDNNNHDNNNKDSHYNGIESNQTDNSVCVEELKEKYLTKSSASHTAQPFENSESNNSDIDMASVLLPQADTLKKETNNNDENTLLDVQPDYTMMQTQQNIVHDENSKANDVNCKSEVGNDTTVTKNTSSHVDTLEIDQHPSDNDDDNNEDDANEEDDDDEDDEDDDEEQGEQVQCDECHASFITAWPGKRWEDKHYCTECAFVCVCKVLTPYSGAFVCLEGTRGPYCRKCWEQPKLLGCRCDTSIEFLRSATDVDKKWHRNDDK